MDIVCFGIGKLIPRRVSALYVAKKVSSFYQGTAWKAHVEHNACRVHWEQLHRRRYSHKIVLRPSLTV